jgi:hypothetical protein
MVHLGASDRFPEMGPWCVTAIGSHLCDTYQLVARKSLEVPLSDVRVASGPHSNKVLSTLGLKLSYLGSQGLHSRKPGTLSRRPHHYGHGELSASPGQVVQPVVRSCKKHDWLR